MAGGKGAVVIFCHFDGDKMSSIIENIQGPFRGQIQSSLESLHHLYMGRKYDPVLLIGPQSSIYVCGLLNNAEIQFQQTRNLTSLLSKTTTNKEIRLKQSNINLSYLKLRNHREYNVRGISLMPTATGHIQKCLWLFVTSPVGLATDIVAAELHETK